LAKICEIQDSFFLKPYLSAYGSDDQLVSEIENQILKVIIGLFEWLATSSPMLPLKK
jgi:hypothetical protein